MARPTVDQITENITKTLDIKEQVRLAGIGIGMVAGQGGKLDRADGAADGYTTLGDISRFLENRIKSTSYKNPTEIAFRVALEGEDQNSPISLEDAKKVVEKVLKKLDLNHDGKITVAEATQYLQSRHYAAVNINKGPERS